MNMLNRLSSVLTAVELIFREAEDSRLTVKDLEFAQKHVFGHDWKTAYEKCSIVLRMVQHINRQKKEKNNGKV